MVVMGFSFDPGPLPFVTIRAAKWGNRLQVGDYVQAQGEHGCSMPKTPCKVIAIERYRGLPPSWLAHVREYSGSQPLVSIALGPVDMGPQELFKRFGFPV